MTLIAASFRPDGLTFASDSRETEVTGDQAGTFVDDCEKVLRLDDSTIMAFSGLAAHMMKFAAQYHFRKGLRGAELLKNWTQFMFQFHKLTPERLAGYANLTRGYLSCAFLATRGEFYYARVFADGRAEIRSLPHGFYSIAPESHFHKEFLAACPHVAENDKPRSMVEWMIQNGNIYVGGPIQEASL
jgi:hypothetical protein